MDGLKKVASLLFHLGALDRVDAFVGLFGDELLEFTLAHDLLVETVGPEFVHQEDPFVLPVQSLRHELVHQLVLRVALLIEVLILILLIEHRHRVA